MAAHSGDYKYEGFRNNYFSGRFKFIMNTVSVGEINNRIWILLLFSAFFINDTTARIGLFAGDVKHHKAPRIFRRYTHHAPVNINIRSAAKTPIYTPKTSLNKPQPYQIGVPHYMPPKIPSKYTLMEPFMGLNMGRPGYNMGRSGFNIGRSGFNSGNPGLNMYQLMMSPWFSQMMHPLLIPLFRKSMMNNMKSMRMWGAPPYGKITGTKAW